MNGPDQNAVKQCAWSTAVAILTFKIYPRGQAYKRNVSLPLAKGGKITPDEGGRFQARRRQFPVPRYFACARVTRDQWTAVK